MIVDTGLTTGLQDGVSIGGVPAQPLVVGLDDLAGGLAVPVSNANGRDLAAIVGGKGANLALLKASGLPVPPGFCVTTEAFRLFATGCANLKRTWAALAALGPSRVDEVQALAAQIRADLAAAPMPIAVRDAVIAAWRAQGRNRTYAVRSSATNEDQPRASFAGQGETRLNVRGCKHL